MNNDVSDLLQRIDALQNAHRRMRGASMLFLMCLGLVILTAGGARTRTLPGNPTKEIRAERFVLVGAKGETLGEFGVAPDGAMRLFVHRDGGAGAWLGIRADGIPHVALTHANGRGLLQLTGNPEAPSLQIYGVKGEDRIVIEAKKDASATIVLSDPAGKARTVLGVYDDGACGLTLFDGHDKQRGFFMAYPERAATLHILDKHRKVIWKAPSE